jgi:hypothetical protein
LGKGYIEWFCNAAILRGQAGWLGFVSSASSHLYPVYTQASQYTHGGHAATWI